MSGVVSLLRDLVQIPSPSREEGPIVKYLTDAFETLGWKAVREGKNLYTELGDEGPLLLLNSHTDTVPVGEGWSHNPLAAHIVDRKIYGRGSNDAKGCLAAMMYGAFAAFAKNPPKGRVLLAATCEEEISGQGLEQLLKILPKPDAAVVGEPTGLQPAVAQKGLLLLEVIAKGRSAHAAWGGGVNAVTAAARDILSLSNVSFDKSHPALGVPSLEVTQAHGGERHNVIPDRCKMVVDIRTTPTYTPEEIIDLVSKKVEGDVEVRSKRLVSVDTDPDHPIVQAAVAANPGAKPFGSPTVSDWVFLRDIPTVKVGPGDSHRSHTPDEYVTVSELEEGAAFYERLIREYFERA